MAKKSSKDITTGKGLWLGLLILGQVTAILVLTSIAGYVLDLTFGTRPFALTGSVVIGGMGATLLVVREVARLAK